MANSARAILVAVVPLGAVGCAATPPTTLNHAPRVMTTECSVTVADDTALFDVGLAARTPNETTNLVLGEGDHLAARRGDGPLALLAPYLAWGTSEGHSAKKYEASIVGNGDPRIAWSRGEDPYAWVTIPTPPALDLRFEREPSDTLSWASLGETAPDIQTELWLTCEDASQGPGCGGYGSYGPTHCGVRRAFPKAVSSVLVADLVKPAPDDGDISKCDVLVVLATRTQEVNVSATGLAPDATCASRRTSTLKLPRSRP